MSPASQSPELTTPMGEPRVRNTGAIKDKAIYDYQTRRGFEQSTDADVHTEVTLHHVVHN